MIRSSSQVRKTVKREIRSMIKEHQRLPGSVWQGIAQRWSSKKSEEPEQAVSIVSLDRFLAFVLITAAHAHQIPMYTFLGTLAKERRGNHKPGVGFGRHRDPTPRSFRYRGHRRDRRTRRHLNSCIFDGSRSEQAASLIYSALGRNSF